MTAAPARSESTASAASWRQSLRGPGFVAVGAIMAGGALWLRDPHVPGAWGMCPVYATTGMYCSTCGALRATADLLQLDVVAAWNMNQMWVVTMPVLLVWWGWWAVRRRYDLPRRSVPGWVWWVVGALWLIFTVARNLPWFTYLAPH